MVRCVEEKAAQYRRTFAKIGRFEPTSQVCSACGARDGPKPLPVRTWICRGCDAVHDRDVNAARNVQQKSAPFTARRTSKQRGSLAGWLGWAR